MRRKTERLLDKAITLALHLFVAGFAMAAGAACYHQSLMQQKEPAAVQETEVVFICQQAPAVLDDERNEREAKEAEERFNEQMAEEQRRLEEFELFATCVEAEAGNQSIEGKRMVADVILNRVRDSDFPNTITEVITQPYHFSSYWNGAMDNVIPSEETIRVCEMEMAEVGWPGLFFFTAEDWPQYGTRWKQVGDHYFNTK